MNKTVVELDLKGYSDVARELEEHFSAELVMKFNEQIQSFFTDGLKLAGVASEEAILATTGDGAILVFDSPTVAHIFAEAIHNASRLHNEKKTFASAKRWFRIGIATGELAVDYTGGTKKMAGSVVARSVRLEAACHIGEIIIDSETYLGLSQEQQDCYGAEEQIPGKRDEEFLGRRYPVISGLVDIPAGGKRLSDGIQSNGTKQTATAENIPATTSPPPRDFTPNNLPQSQSFFGRAEELQRITEALAPERNSWGVLIYGSGGMGKTSLAIHAACNCPSGQFERIIFLSVKNHEMDDDGERNLTGLILSGVLEMMNELARQLGQPDIIKFPEDQRVRLLLDVLRSTKILLILDNLESLTKEDRDRLLFFVKNLPQPCKAILTSRCRVGSSAEVLFLEQLDRDAALATLADLSRNNKLLARTSEAERISLCEQTGGKPLLLRWVAGQIGFGSCRTFAEALSFLRSCPPDNDPLEFIFGDLAREFTKNETNVLVALACFSLPAKIEHITPLAAIEKMAVETALHTLSNRSLVVPNQSETTFALVPVVASFLQRRFSKDFAETQWRLEQKAYGLIIENGRNHHDRYTVLDSVWPLVAPALPLFLVGANDRLQTVCGALADFLNFTGRWDEYLSLENQAEAVALAAGDYYNAGWRARHAGRLSYFRRQGDAAVEYGIRATSHWRTANAGSYEFSLAIRLRGAGLCLKGDYAAAIEALRESLALSRSLNVESEDVAITLNLLAEAESQSGDFSAAEKNYHEALRVSRAVGYSAGEAANLGNLARLALIHKDWKQAATLAGESLSLSEKLNHQLGIASSSNRFAQALIGQGKIMDATPYARRAVEIFTKLRHPDLEIALQVYKDCQG